MVCTLRARMHAKCAEPASRTAVEKSWSAAVVSLRADAWHGPNSISRRAAQRRLAATVAAGIRNGFGDARDNRAFDRRRRRAAGEPFRHCVCQLI